MFIAAFLLAAAGPAAEPPASADPAATTTTIVDPRDQNNPMICRREKAIGSMLQTKKTCMRRSEWDAQRELNRQSIQSAQVQRPTKN